MVPSTSSMGITWTVDDSLFMTMERIFLQLGKKAISMNHYDLANLVSKETKEGTLFSPAQWKAFLTDPRVCKYIEAEFEAIKEAELRKIIVDINGSNSVGRAQIINSLSKLLDNDDKIPDGPAFVYCYVPLTENQMKADNIVVLDSDPFVREN